MPERLKGKISPSLLRVMEHCLNKHFQKLTQENEVQKKTLFVWSYSPQVPKPVPLSLILKEVQLGGQQGQKEAQYPELLFHVVGKFHPAFRLMEVHCVGPTWPQPHG